MSKKDVVKSDVPIVTSLPLPSSDSVLVIDLPDGQKLLVGKMAPGSVIEVATWRGTGRPDSRTNRLMLGMSNGDNPQTQEEYEPEELNKFSVQYLISIVKQAKPIFAKIFVKLRGLLSKINKNDAKLEEKVTPDLDVEEWLNRITSKASDRPNSEKTEIKSVNSGKSTRKSPKNQKSSSRKTRK